MAYFNPEQYVTIAKQCLNEANGRYLRSVNYTDNNQKIQINNVSYSKKLNTIYGLISFTVEFEIQVKDSNNRVIEWYVQICEFDLPQVEIVHLDLLKHAFIEGDRLKAYMDRFRVGFTKLFAMPANT